MQYTKLPSIAVSAAIALAATVSPALLAADVDGSSDHPLVPRVAGSEILSYTYRQLEQVSIPTGATERVPDADNPRRGSWTYPKSETVEGEHWSIVYGLPEEASTLQIAAVGIAARSVGGQPSPRLR